MFGTIAQCNEFTRWRRNKKKGIAKIESISKGKMAGNMASSWKKHSWICFLELLREAEEK